MRYRQGNPFHDQHEHWNPDWAMFLYDFVTLPHTNPHDVARAVEVVCPDLGMFGRGAPAQARRELTPDGMFMLTEAPRTDRDWVNGAVWTSVRPDGSLYVCLGTYAQACADPDCKAGHMNHGTQTAVRQGRPLSRAEQQAIKDLVGESDDWPLGAGYDHEVLSGLGFTPVDAPLLGENVADADLYRALDVLLFSSPPTWAGRVAMLDHAGYEIAFKHQHPSVWDVLPQFFKPKEAA